MKNSKKKQKSEWRELSREELKTINGGVTYKLILNEKGQLILVKISD